MLFIVAAVQSIFRKDPVEKKQFPERISMSLAIPFDRITAIIR